MRKFVKEIGSMFLFGVNCVSLLLRHGVAIRPLVMEMYEVGVRSIFTTVFSGLFVGAIMAIQIFAQLRDFGAESFLGGLSTSVTIRNVGPVLIAFILSGKVGAYTSAELGTMKVTDQINVIRCLGLNPIRFILLPRLVAVVLSSFLLLVIGLMLTVVGGILISSIQLNLNLLNYLSRIPDLVTGGSITIGLIKSIVFGILIGLISCYEGYFCEPGASGVGKAVRKTSVIILTTIILANFLMQIFI